MKYLSVASGIEAASYSWEPLGWKPWAFSQFDPDHNYKGGPDFASAVLAFHYPHVPNLGDMTKFEEWPHANVDVLVGGTPCQSFSVAGLRGGLDDERGNLMLTFAAIARKYRPRWLAWENVPGVLSDDGGRSFAGLLGLLSGRRVEVPSGGWQSAGIVVGYQGAYGLAWRVLDSQFVRVDGFGRAVPQRRRRVFVVGYLGDWRRAAAVLFERSSMSGNSPPRRIAREGLAQAVAGCLGGSSQTGGFRTTDLDNQGAFIPEIANPLTARMHKGVNTTMDEGQTMIGQPIVFDETQITHPENRSKPRPGAPSHALASGARPPTIAYSQEVADPLVAGEQRTYTHEGANNFRTRNAQAFQPRFARNGRGAPDVVAAALTGEAGRTGKGDSAQCVVVDWRVRRLTPTECERLQGFPDGYTNIPWRGKNGAPDGPRYKVLGNSMSCNVMRWLGRRIEMVDKIAK